MTDERFKAPLPAEELSMTNELLMLQAQVLRSKVDQADQKVNRVKASLENRFRIERDELTSRLQRAEAELIKLQDDLANAAQRLDAMRLPAESVVIPMTEHEGLKRARRDLIRLLERLGRGLPGSVIRRYRGYRNLRERYLK